MGRVPTRSGVVKGILFRVRGGARRPERVLVAEKYVLAADAGAGVVVLTLSGETIVRPRPLIRSQVVGICFTTLGAGAFFETGSLAVPIVGFSTEVGARVPESE